MSTWWWLAPDFALIALGAGLMHMGRFDTGFWLGVEKLVYFVLFPALLFHAVAQAPLDLQTTGALVPVVLGICGCGMLFGWLAKRWMSDTRAWSSLFQCGFRFNSYIALALAGRLGGEPGLALMGLIIGVAVPVVNAAAVFALAQHSNTRNTFQALLYNPLLLATLAGLGYQAWGPPLPGPVATTLSRLGAAALALGLITVGAGLRVDGVRRHTRALGYFTAVKLCLLPFAAWPLARWAGLQGLTLQMVLLFAALPTASSAYVLAQRMGGDGSIVAAAITLSTVLSVITMTFWLTWI